MIVIDDMRSISALILGSNVITAHSISRLASPAGRVGGAVPCSYGRHLISARRRKGESI
jgi:hypothetical protein